MPTLPKMYLPGLKTKTVEYAKNFSFPKEKLLETFCRMFRRAGATPGLLKGSSPQLRGLSADNLCNSERLQQVHEGELTGHCGIPAASPSRPQRDGLRQHNRESLTPLEVTCIWNIKRSIRPCHYLRRLLNVVKTAKDPADKDKP